MAALLSLAILAAAASQPATNDQPVFAPSAGARASAQATVRILPGARVRLGISANAENYLVSSATVKDETGAKRPAKLVEFQ